MARDTLLDFFEDFATQPDIFIVHDDGYRVRQMSYRQVAEAARAWTSTLARDGIVAGDKVVLWSENRAEWIAALWGALLAGVVVVPVDFRASGDLVARISAIVGAKIVLVGHEVVAPPGVTGRVVPLTEAITFAEPGTDAATTDERANRPVSSPGSRPTGATLAEIIFTSGATADPKGVTITHRNVLANIIPIEREIRKYRRYARPFHPLRFLNLLPLSHMFGQSMATFVPPMLSGTVVFSHGYSPTEILRQIKSRRVSVLVCVPKVLDVLREHIERVSPITAAPDSLAGKHWAWRWWHYREVHRLFGFKFWCIVCGAAPLDPELEAFWRKLGFLVVQGYGLTETAPIVTLNHPLRASKGTVGTPIGGVEVKIAPDGEILVRGDNVTQGYYKPEGESGPPKAGSPKSDEGSPKSDEGGAFKDGWFHTGDIGELDSAGRLLIKGRKKEMIVTPQGLNVFPEDVERALAAQPGVKEAAVIGLRVEGEERIHAALVLEDQASVEAIVRGANAVLEDHQRIWSTSIWPGDALPRTEGTQKLKRREIQRWAAGEQTSAPTRSAASVSVEAIVGRYSAGRDVTSDTTLEELGLSSLDRVELMMALEEAFQTTLDESDLGNSRTIGEIKDLVGTGKPGPATHGAASAAPGAGSAADDRGESRSSVPDRKREPIAFPSWNRSGLSWFIRRISLPTWILPLGRPFMDITVRGVEHLDGLEGPVVFAANHQSHLDGPAILMSLPVRWRYSIAPAMAKEFFRAHFNRHEFGWKAWFTNSLNYYLACQFFNAFPLPQREAGTRETMRYMGEVLADDYSILIFPEGRRERDEIGTFRPGIGMIGSKLDAPVIPVRIEGLDKVLHPKMKWPKRGPVRVSFGAPLRLVGDDYPTLAKQVEDAVRTLGGGPFPG